MLAEYFQRRNAGWHIPKYEFGDRIRGTYKGIPFSGSVGTDGIRNLDDGPIVTVTLDLPIMVDNERRCVLVVKHEDIGYANEYKFSSDDEGRKTRKAKASPKASRGKAPRA